MRVELNQQKNGLLALRLPLDEVDRRRRRLVVDRLHPLLGERAGILDGLLADLAEARIDVGSSRSDALQRSTPRGPNFARNAGSRG